MVLEKSNQQSLNVKCHMFYDYVLQLLTWYLMNYKLFAGEHIKNWRRRYFILRDNGTFYGFKSKPEHDLQDPLNNFTVRGDFHSVTLL